MKLCGSTAFWKIASNLAWLQSMGEKGSLENEEVKEVSRGKSQKSSYAKQFEFTFFMKLIGKHIKNMYVLEVGYVIRLTFQQSMPQSQ